MDVEESAPLPAILMAQHESHFGNWAKRYTLKNGYNRIEVPKFPIESWALKTNAGVPIYFENIYTPEKQGGAPRIRIKGCSKTR